MVATNCQKWSPSWPTWTGFGRVLYAFLVFFWNYVNIAISTPLSSHNQIIRILRIHVWHFFSSFRGLGSRCNLYRLFYRFVVALGRQWLPKWNPKGGFFSDLLVYDTAGVPGSAQGPLRHPPQSEISPKGVPLGRQRLPKWNPKGISFSDLLVYDATGVPGLAQGPLRHPKGAPTWGPPK